MPKHINKYEKENALNEIHFKEDMYGDVLDVQESELDNQQDNLGCRGKKTISKVCMEIITTIYKNMKLKKV
jgi:hypothetical protein